MARDDPHFRLRIPEELKKRIELAAAQNHRSINAEIIAMLELVYPSDAAPLPGEPMDKDAYASFLADEDEIWSIIRVVEDLKDKLIRNHQASLRRDRRASLIADAPDRKK